MAHLYAVTDKNGLAKFENVLISGDTPYVVEEVERPLFEVHSGNFAASHQ